MRAQRRRILEQLTRRTSAREQPMSPQMIEEARDIIAESIATGILAPELRDQLIAERPSYLGEAEAHRVRLAAEARATHRRAATRSPTTRTEPAAVALQAAVAQDDVHASPRPSIVYRDALPPFFTRPSNP